KKNAIEIIDLKKAFVDDDYVLNGINLSIPKGKITVIIGFSGTGKSVLLKHILGLLKPTSGTINILGKDISTMTDDERVHMRRHFGVLFQYAALFDDMTVLDNVQFPLKEHRKDLSKKQIKDIAYQKLKQSGLDEKHYKKLPGEVSGGMRKRCGLARALALDPDILIYDEPTTGLDPILTEMVDNLILDTHNHTEDSSTLVVSHDLHAAFRIGDYVAMLDSGKVLLHGPPKVFLESDNPLVSRFVSKGVRKT
ncbi:MAG: ATP-binding cassette domain-containing protein, partial [Pseudomonadota bacterium]